MEKERALLLWINAIIYNSKLIDQMTCEKMERKIKSRLTKTERGDKMDV